MRARLRASVQLVLALTFVSSYIGVGPFASSPNTFSAPALQAPAVLPSPSQSGTSARVDGERLIRDVQALAAPELQGRLTGTDGSRRAQSYILARFKELRLQPVHESHEQRFSFTEMRRTTSRELADATNLMAMIRGRSSPDEFILVTAHYDHLGIRDGQTYYGADDNASGVAAMLGIAGWFAANPPQKSVMFVAFDAEEHGLQGSKHFVAHPPIDLARVSVIVNVDMIARGDNRNLLSVAGTSHNPALKGVVSGLADGRRISIALAHDRPGIPGEDDWTRSSDHAPFHAAGIPFLYFGVENHPDYHKPTDTADRIPFAFYREATEVVLEAVRRLTEMPAVPRVRHAAQGVGR